MCSTPAVCVIGNVGGNQSNKGFKQGKLSRHSTRVKHPNSKTYKKKSHKKYPIHIINPFDLFPSTQLKESIESM